MEIPGFKPKHCRIAVAIAFAVFLVLPGNGSAAITPSIAGISNPVFVGGSMTITGSVFTAGSVANFFVATATGPVNFGPLPQSANTGTTLTIPVPASKVTTLGQGVVSVVVINTDQGFTQSNSITTQLFGETADGFPNLMTINGVGLAATSTDPSFATDNVEMVVVQNQKVVLGGDGFDTVHGVGIDLFCDCPGGKIPTVHLKPDDAGLTSGALTFTLPTNAVTGPGSFVIYNKGVKGDYALKSNAVSVPVGATITVRSVKQTGCTVTVDGTGFAILQSGLPAFTVINLFNKQGGGVENLGGLNSSAEPVIPLNVISADQFTFTLAGVAFVPGPAYVQVLNPPFVRFTSSGDSPNGAFTAAGCGPTPTPTSTPTPTPIATNTPVPTPTATQVSLFVVNSCSGTVTSYAGDNGDIAPNKLSVFLCPTDLAFDSQGNLYVANHSWITVYPAGSSGNTLPSATIIGPKTNLTSISGIALDSNANIYALTATAIMEFTAGSNGNVAPVAQITGANTGLNFPRSIAVDSEGNIYVANESGDDILVFAAGSNGNTAPSRIISGKNTGLAGPVRISLDHQNNIYVLNSGCAPDNRIVSPSITVYAAGSTGNISPTRTISGSNTGISNFSAGIAADSAGDVFLSGLVTNSSSSIPSVSEFAAGSNGNVAPQRTISGTNTGLGLVGPIAVNEKSGNIGVIADTGASPPYIEQFTLGSSGNVAPDVVLGNLAPQLNLPIAVAVDGSGKLYVANSERGGFGSGCPPIQADIRNVSAGVRSGAQNSITVYAQGSSADAPPIASISGSNTRLAFPDSVAVDATKIYVANGSGGSSFQGSVTEYPINSNGNVPPVMVISGPDTGLEDPTGIALDISGNIYVANAAGGSSFTGSITVYAPASNGDAKPITTISGSNTALSLPKSIGVDKKGNVYVGNSNNSITVYLASANGNVTPSATIKGSKTGLTPGFLGWIAVDGNGDIFASSGGFETTSSSVLMFPSGSNGNIAPAAILAGPHTELAFPEGLAVLTP